MGGFLIELFMSDAIVLMIQSDKIPNDKVREKCSYISRIAYKYDMKIYVGALYRKYVGSISFTC